jgi:hypothetical protein
MMLFLGIVCGIVSVGILGTIALFALADREAKKQGRDGLKKRGR